jgi:hypothetical protein
MLSSLVVYVLNPSVLMGINIFFLPGIIFLLSIESFKKIKEAVFASVVFGVVFGIPFEAVNLANNSWYYANNYFVIPNIIFNIPFEVFLWYFFFVFSIILFYQAFLNIPHKLHTHKCVKVISLGLVFWLLVLIKIPTLTYSYFITGIAACLPFLLFIFTERKFNFKKYILPTIVLGSFFFVMEMICLDLKYWSFNGNYIYSFKFVNFQIPIEEIILWVLLSPAILISYFEIFIDDGK